MVQRCEDDEEDHKDQRTDSLCWGGAHRNAENAEDADFGDVEPNEELLHGAGIHQALGVVAGAGFIEEVVAVGEVEEVEADGGEAEDEGCDDGVGDGDNEEARKDRVHGAKAQG